MHYQKSQPQQISIDSFNPQNNATINKDFNSLNIEARTSSYYENTNLCLLESKMVNLLKIKNFLEAAFCRTKRYCKIKRNQQLIYAAVYKNCRKPQSNSTNNEKIDQNIIRSKKQKKKKQLINQQQNNKREDIRAINQGNPNQQKSKKIESINNQSNKFEQQNNNTNTERKNQTRKYFEGISKTNKDQKMQYINLNITEDKKIKTKLNHKIRENNQCMLKRRRQNRRDQMMNKQKKQQFNFNFNFNDEISTIVNKSFLEEKQSIKDLQELIFFNNQNNYKTIKTNKTNKRKQQQTLQQSLRSTKGKTDKRQVRINYFQVPKNVVNLKVIQIKKLTEQYAKYEHRRSYSTDHIKRQQNRSASIKRQQFQTNTSQIINVISSCKYCYSVKRRQCFGKVYSSSCKKYQK